MATFIRINIAILDAVFGNTHTLISFLHLNTQPSGFIQFSLQIEESRLNKKCSINPNSNKMHYAFIFPAIEQSKHLRLIAHVMTQNNHIWTYTSDLCIFFNSLCLRGLKMHLWHSSNCLPSKEWSLNFTKVSFFLQF